jgi:tRNA U38,U39,U40 pseudouridine synthase TruA
MNQNEPPRTQLLLCDLQANSSTRRQVRLLVFMILEAQRHARTIGDNFAVIVEA